MIVYPAFIKYSAKDFFFFLSTEKCPSGWHHYEKTASCYKVYLRNENYWQAVDTCQKVNGSLATFVTNEELQFILKIEVDFDEKVCERRDQCKWVFLMFSFDWEFLLLQTFTG